MNRLLSLLLLAAAARAQTVQGIAINSVNRKPVPGAIVQLVGAASDSADPDIYRAETDAAGHFRFDRVIPGHYRAIADAQGFTRMLSQGNIVARAPRIAVESSSPVLEVGIPMIPASVISGRVVDSDGDPVSYVSIEALQYTYSSGKKVLRAIANERTNDRGEYRLYGLMPGRYFVRATMRTGGAVGYSPLFFPAAREISQASALDAPPGAELRSIDIVLRPDTLHSISGRVVDGQTGQPVANVYITARTGADRFANGAPQLTDSFTVHGLPPGKYILYAQEFSGGAPKAAHQLVDLGEADLTGVVLSLVSGIDFSGTIRAGNDVPEEAARIHLSLQPAESFGGTSADTRVSAAGAFTFKNILPDAYHLLWTLPKGVYVKSIRQGNRLLPDDLLDLTGPLAALAIQLAADGGRIQGTVRNAAGEPVPGAVVTMSATPSYDFWSAETDDSGRFEIRDLAPGDYRVLAFDNAPQGAPQDPDFRKTYEKQAVRVQVLPSTQQKLDLVAVPPAG